MASENAKMVARKVFETIRAGKRVNKGLIIRQNGYSKETANHPHLVTETESYKSVMRPVVAQLERERENAIKRLGETIDQAQYHQLVDAIDKFTKNIQLLSGKETENTGFTINIVSYKK